MIPHCPKCKEPLVSVEYKVEEYYKYNEDTEGYSEDNNAFFTHEVQCPQCNTDLVGHGIGYDQGPVNFDLREYIGNIKEAEEYYQ